MRFIRIIITVIFVFLLSSCYPFDGNYDWYQQRCDVSSERKINTGLFETAGLIEYGYDVPVFDGDDEASIIACESDNGLETWFFGTEYDGELIVVELDGFFVDIDYIINKVVEYNDLNEVDIVLYDDLNSFALGDLYAGGMLESTLSDFSSNLLLLSIGTMSHETQTFDYFIRVVKYPDNTFKIIAVEHSGDEFIELIDLNE